MKNNVIHPKHYQPLEGMPEVIDLIEGMGFCEGCVLKYILRAPFKDNPAEDFQKAAWYLERAVNGPAHPGAWNYNAEAMRRTLAALKAAGDSDTLDCVMRTWAMHTWSALATFPRPEDATPLEMLCVKVLRGYLETMFRLYRTAPETRAGEFWDMCKAHLQHAREKHPNLYKLPCEGEKEKSREDLAETHDALADIFRKDQNENAPAASLVVKSEYHEFFAELCRRNRQRSMEEGADLVATVYRCIETLCEKEGE